MLVAFHVMVCIMEVGNIYQDSVKSDQSEIVIEEIEINTESNFLPEAADQEYVLQINMVSPNYQHSSASELQKVDVISYKESDRFNLYHKQLSEPMVHSSSVRPDERNPFQALDLTNSSSLLSGNVIKKVLVLQPNDDSKAVTAKAVDEIMASLNQRGASETAESAQEETIVEIISIKTGCGKKQEILLKEVSDPYQLPQQEAALKSREPIILGESFRRELDSPPHHLSCSEFRTPSPVGRGERLQVRMMDLENVSANCYFNSQLLSVKLASPDRTELKSVENHVMGSRIDGDHGAEECSSSYLSRRKVKEREKLEHDCGNITYKGCPEQVKHDVDKKQPLVNMCNSRSNVLPGTMPPLCLAGNHLSAYKIKEDDKERDKRPPYSYVQLIQMALCSKMDRRMTLREIYEWVENRFSYYKYHKNPGWKNSIRHSLSLSDIFVRKKTGHNGRSGSAYWTLDVARLSEKRDVCATLKLNNGENDARMLQTDGQDSTEITIGSFFQPIAAVTSTGLEFSLQNDVSIMPYEETIEQNQTLILTKPPSRKRGSASDVRSVNRKQQRYSMDGELICSSVGDVATLLHVTADSSIVDQSYACDDVKQSCYTVGETETSFPRRDMSDALVDSTSEMPATVTCASELLCWSDRRTGARTDTAKSHGLPKPKLYRHHRRKQDLRVLRSASEVDELNENSKPEGAVADSHTPMTSECDLGDATQSVAICLVKTPNEEDALHTPKDEEDINHMLFTPFKTSSGGPFPYLSWVSPINDLSPISSNPNLFLTPSGLDSAWAVSGLDSARGGATTPYQLADSTPYTTPVITKLLLDCLNGRASCADVNLDNRIFCSLLGDEVHEQAEYVDSDFIGNLFPFN